MQANAREQQQQLHGKILGRLEAPSSQPGAPNVPKEDKILEWTLFKIYEELKKLNDNVGNIRSSLKS
jgi:hypothetical protein